MSFFRKALEMLLGQRKAPPREEQKSVAQDLQVAIRRNEMAGERLRSVAMTDVFRQITDRMQ